MAEACECGNEPSGSVKCGDVVLRICHLHIKTEQNIPLLSDTNISTSDITFCIMFLTFRPYIELSDEY